MGYVSDARVLAVISINDKFAQTNQLFQNKGNNLFRNRLRPVANLIKCLLRS